MGGRWSYSWFFGGYCFQDLFNIVLSMLEQLPSSIFFLRLVSVYVVHLYYRNDSTTAWKELRFILSDRFDFHMIENLSIAVHAFVSGILVSFSVDRTLLPRYVNLSTSIIEPPLSVEMSPLWLKHMDSCLNSHGGLCLLLPGPDYTAGIRPGQVYLLEVLSHQRSLRL